MVMRAEDEGRSFHGRRRRKSYVMSFGRNFFFLSRQWRLDVMLRDNSKPPQQLFIIIHVGTALVLTKLIPSSRNIKALRNKNRATSQAHFHPAQKPLFMKCQLISNEIFCFSHLRLCIYFAEALKKRKKKEQEKEKEENCIQVILK